MCESPQTCRFSLPAHKGPRTYIGDVFADRFAKSEKSPQTCAFQGNREAVRPSARAVSGLKILHDLVMETGMHMVAKDLLALPFKNDVQLPAVLEIDARSIVIR